MIKAYRIGESIARTEERVRLLRQEYPDIPDWRQERVAPDGWVRQAEGARLRSTDLLWSAGRFISLRGDWMVVPLVFRGDFVMRKV